jgi:hypothetical protein
MIKLIALVAVFTAALGCCAADPCGPWKVGRRTAAALRVGALGFVVVAIVLWQRVEPGPAAYFSVAFAALSSASVCALLAPYSRKLLTAAVCLGWVSAAAWSMF